MTDLNRAAEWLKHYSSLLIDEEDSIIFLTKEVAAATENPEDRQHEECQQLDPQEPPQVRPDDVDKNLSSY